MRTIKRIVEPNYRTLAEEYKVEQFIKEIEAHGGVTEVLEINNRQFCVILSPCTAEQAAKFETYLNKLKRQHKIILWSRWDPGSPKKKPPTAKAKGKTETKRKTNTRPVLNIKVIGAKETSLYVWLEVDNTKRYVGLNQLIRPTYWDATGRRGRNKIVFFIVEEATEERLKEIQEILTGTDKDKWGILDSGEYLPVTNPILLPWGKCTSP